MDQRSQNHETQKAEKIYNESGRHTAIEQYLQPVGKTAHDLVVGTDNVNFIGATPSFLP